MASSLRLLAADLKQRNFDLKKLAVVRNLDDAAAVDDDFFVLMNSPNAYRNAYLSEKWGGDISNAGQRAYGGKNAVFWTRNRELSSPASVTTCAFSFWAQ